MSDGQAAPAAVIELQAVHKWYGDFHVLRDIHLQVGKGEKVVVCGPSGSGKSTMIRCINRLEEHQQGRIVVAGIELNADMKNIEAIRREVGMVFQQFNLFPHLTVLQNLTLAPIWVRKLPKKRQRRPRGITWNACVSPIRPINIPVSFPEVSSSVWRSRARCA